MWAYQERNTLAAVQREVEENLKVNLKQTFDKLFEKSGVFPSAGPERRN